MSYGIDIETIPDLSMVDLLPPVKPDSRLKDEVKKAADIEEKKKAQIAKMALNPMFAKVVCIGIYGEDFKECLVGDEKEIIQKFREITHKKMTYTWNGKGFDYDVIGKRGLLHGLNTLAEAKYLTDRYASGFHTDLMEKFCQNREYVALDTVAKVYLGEGKNDCDVQEIPELLKTPEGVEKLKNYCLKDAELTYRLAVKFGYEDWKYEKRD